MSHPYQVINNICLFLLIVSVLQEQKFGSDNKFDPKGIMSTAIANWAVYSYSCFKSSNQVMGFTFDRDNPYSDLEIIS